MITRGELQRSVSPKFTRKLIGTVIKEEGETKPNIKKEEDLSRNTRRANRSWPTDAKLVHVDRTPCSEECMRTHPDDDEPALTLNKSIKETNGPESRELHGVPAPSATVIGNKEFSSADENMDNAKTVCDMREDTCENSETTGPELQGVPDKSTTQEDAPKDTVGKDGTETGTGADTRSEL